MLNILYVEDDQHSRDVMKMVQRSNPDLMEISIFENSEYFEQLFLELQPPLDVILLDIHVKPIDGFQMLEIIRLHPEYDDIPVVALTASVMNEEVQSLKDAGFHSVCSKPIDLDSFPNLLGRILQGERIWHVL